MCWKPLVYSWHHPCSSSSILNSKVREPLTKTTALARHDDNRLGLSCPTQQEVLIKNTAAGKSNQERQEGRDREGYRRAERRKEAACPSNLPDTFTPGIHLGRERHTYTRKTLSQTKHGSGKTTGQR